MGHVPPGVGKIVAIELAPQAAKGKSSPLRRDRWSDRPAAQRQTAASRRSDALARRSRAVRGRTLAAFCVAGQTQQPDGRDESAGARPSEQRGHRCGGARSLTMHRCDRCTDAEPLELFALQLSSETPAVALGNSGGRARPPHTPARESASAQARRHGRRARPACAPVRCNCKATQGRNMATRLPRHKPNASGHVVDWI